MGAADSQMIENTSNQVPGYEEWTAWRGLLRALLWGGLMTLILIAVLDLMAWAVPRLVLNWWLRMAMGFFVALTLFAVVHRAAGMAGGACTGLVVAFTLLVLISQHIVFALHGVLSTGVQADGWMWLDPSIILLVNTPALVGIGFCAALCHGGGAVARAVSDILMQRM